MRLKLIISCALAFIAILASPQISVASSDYLSRYESRKLPKIKPPRVKLKVLENGMRLYLLEDHTIPIVKLGAIMKCGSIYDPADKVGLSTITGMLMRSGGAGDRNPEEFDEALDDLGAKLGSGIGAEMGTANLEVLSSDLDEGLSLFFDMIFKPRFDAKRLSVAKHKVLESLRRQADDPQTLAGYKYSQLLYGKNSPWARRPDKKSVSRITTIDVRKYHGKYFKTNNVIITAAGDFKKRDLIRIIKSLVKGAPAGEIGFPKVEPVVLKYQSKFEGIEKPLSQAFIRMGHLSIKRFNPDKFALFLADDILGASGFMSRLVKDIRALRGMAYSIWSSVSIGTDYGTFTVGVNTKASNAWSVIGLVRDHMKKMADRGEITASELDLARQTILARLIFQFDRPFKVVNQEARFYFYGYPENYWSIYRDSIAATTLDEVKAAAAKYFKPEDLEILIVGPKRAMGRGK